VCFPAARFTVQDDALSVIDPRALRQRGDRRLGHLGVVGETEILQAFDDWEPSIDQPPAFASLGSFLVLGFQQRRQIGNRGLLLARRLGGELPEPTLDGGELELGRVRLD
jgi:hypothetical protein